MRGDELVHLVLNRLLEEASGSLAQQVVVHSMTR